MKCNELQNAFGPIPEDCYRALMAAAGGVKEETTVKKKISFVLVMVLVLILAAGVAIALASWQNTARDIVVTEKESGYFETWPVDKKVELAAAVVEHGFVEMTGEAEKLRSGSLPEEEAKRIAESVLSTFTGREVSEISFMEIMQATWGPFEKWTREEQAWYSQLMVDAGLQGQDHTLYAMPEGPVDEQKAISIARREIAKGYGVGEEALEGYEIITSFQVPEFVTDQQAWWSVEMRATDAILSMDRLFSSFWVFIHPETGELYESVDSLIKSQLAYILDAEYRRSDPLVIRMREFGEAHGARQQGSSLEAKALWSQTFSQEVLDRCSKEPDFFNVMDVAFSSFTYGLPDEKSISEEKALALAQKALVEVFLSYAHPGQ